MTVRPETHRASTLVRREALLRAALEVVAERGVGGVTHREIAKRAGVPLSTTSYFFASIDELVLEALRFFVAQTVERFDAVNAALVGQQLRPDEAIDRFAALLLSASEQETVAQFEAYLEVSRRPELRPQVEQALAAFERLARTALHAAGIARPDEAARAFLALVDGFALQRIVRPGGKADASALREAIRVLFAAYTLDKPAGHRDPQHGQHDPHAATGRRRVPAR